MKLVVWIVFTVVAALWTGAFALGAWLVSWVAAFVARAADPNTTLPVLADIVPDWLEAWIDPGTLELAQRVVTGLLQGLQTLQLDLGSAVGWVVAALWLACGVGLLAMLLLAVAAHRWAGRQETPTKAVAV
jgi:hypothetical protein